MKKLIGMAALFFALGTAANAQESKPGDGVKAQHRGEFKDGHHALMESLPDLTDAQKTQLKEMREQGRKESQPQREKMKAMREKLQNMKMSDNPNQKEIDALIDEMHVLKAQMEKSRTAYELKMRSVLTPEQRKVLDEKMKEKHAMRKDKMHSPEEQK
jgi:Spy/CpxP family protein refolding chaperone